MKEWAVWMANKMEEQLLRMEQLRLSEFVAYEKNWKKRLLMQFVGGIARGLGTAVGFTLLGALVVCLYRYGWKEALFLNAVRIALAAFLFGSKIGRAHV